IRKGKHDEALSVLENHDLGPDAVELLQQHVTCLLAQGRGRDAVDLAQAAFDADPTHRRTGPSLILALHETGDAGQARAVLAKIQSTGASPRRIAKLAARLDRDAKGKQV
ncbi:MAG: tetratricopeptide repeat protein, partial [Pseudomonadota bacterium]